MSADEVLVSRVEMLWYL